MSGFCLPASIAICRTCGESDLMSGQVTTFRVVSNGNRGRLECTKHNEVAWDVQRMQPLDGIALEQIKQLQALAKQLEQALGRSGK